MFLGTHHPRLDEKGRLVLPAKFRDELAEGVVITQGSEPCLYVFTPEGFGQVISAAASAPIDDEPARALLRTYGATATDEVPDRQGRVTIPPALRTYAGLDRDLAVLGAVTRVEIWDQATWQTWSANHPRAG